MKKLAIFGGFILLFCSYDPYIPEPFPYKPILLTRPVLENSVEVLQPQNLVKPGKIYISGNYLFINEKYMGIHIINNTDPVNPVNTAFIRIPGCIDMAVKGNVLYADNAVDLVALDMTDLSDIKVTKRIKNTFPELLPPGEDYIPWEFTAANRPEQ